MITSTPRYLLYSEARCTEPWPQDERHQPHDKSDRGRSGGHWRFVLESLDGASVMDVADDEDTDEEDRLELLAVVRGLEALEQPSRVTLVTASQYVSRGLRFGLGEWRESGWQWERFGRLAPIKNGDLWKRVDRALQFHQVECRTWRHESPTIGTINSDSFATAQEKIAPKKRESVYRTVKLRVWRRLFSVWRRRLCNQIIESVGARRMGVAAS